MPVDMLLSRFFREVEQLYPDQDRKFQRTGTWDRRVASCAVPPYRAVFTACLLRGHAAGYRLPSFKQFTSVYVHAIFANEKIPDRDKACLFVDPKTCDEPTPGFLHRLCGFYLDGMAHTQLYVALVQAYEDQRKIGAVASDPRVDWKLKTDIVVMSASRVVRLNIRFGSDELIEDRTTREAVTKARAMASHVTGNPFHERAPVVEVVRDAAHTETFYGLQFFTPACVDEAIRSLDAALDVPPHLGIRYAEMRPVTMRALNDLNKAR